MSPQCHPDLHKYAYGRTDELQKHQVLFEALKGKDGKCGLCQAGRNKEHGALHQCSSCRKCYHPECIDDLRSRQSRRGEPLAYGCPHCGKPWATLAMLEQQAEESARLPGPGSSPRRSMPYSSGILAYRRLEEDGQQQYFCEWVKRGGVICGHGPFDGFDSYYIHYIRTHEEMLEFPCDLCTPVRKFVSASLLVEHKKHAHYSAAATSSTKKRGHSSAAVASLLKKHVGSSEVVTPPMIIVESSSTAESKGKAVDRPASPTPRVERLNPTAAGGVQAPPLRTPGQGESQAMPTDTTAKSPESPRPPSSRTFEFDLNIPDLKLAAPPVFQNRERDDQIRPSYNIDLLRSFAGGHESPSPTVPADRHAQLQAMPTATAAGAPEPRPPSSRTFEVNLNIPDLRLELPPVPRDWERVEGVRPTTSRVEPEFPHYLGSGPTAPAERHAVARAVPIVTTTGSSESRLPNSRTLGRNLDLGLVAPPAGEQDGGQQQPPTRP
ncbi:PHD finger domain-containing protein [Aspergillus saccharolyticus JOP 1030-1]|uniref:PHD-type domain-containing protein n=1 Tax=Aspergillus saccharolyticus JOP 1030-1 TaxID=1450539 RepID=A0A318ZNU1_9EURO|nr:hypothetical protein BP01DRAFT_75309 [Aspergillus saccharolyticus JOP 1030-1]PYH49291.1 hypothetical protein BP01DRAFT_75309 [Aspergillus saccharolyticus JOP 1030-1]